MPASEVPSRIAPRVAQEFPRIAQELRQVVASLK